MQLTGAEIICECLLEQGVDTVFGYPGGAALNTYDALYKYSDRIRHILTAHEQGASHAADGYARATGKTGVVMTTSGPGATNIVTGLATANIDSIPLVAITGNVTTDQLGRDSFQEVDIVNIVKPVTKASFLVEKVEDLADTIRKAFALAQHGRKGPVLVDVPKDVTANKTEFVQTTPEKPRTFEIRNPEKVRVVQEMIKNAKRPMIYAGGGIISADASEEFKAFAELIDAPVCCSLMGLGCIPADHPLCVGNIGMHGGYETGMATAECDLMIACGARFSDRVAGDRERFGEQAKIVQLEIDEKEINKNVKVDEYILGDIKEILIALTIGLDRQNHPDWLAKIEEWKHHFDDKKLHEGSAAAPTAGLHFTKELLQEIEDKGVKLAHVTLHVGLGTFRPVKVENVLDHHMHSEFYMVEESEAEKINQTKRDGGRVICVGTTSCRTIESASDENGILKAGSGWTDIFIYPGYQFKILDCLITNFHLPESTLVMLVSALAGREHVLAAYEEAVKERYRFFSFGDAMFIK